MVREGSAAMVRLALLLCLSLLPAAALAQPDDGALGPMGSAPDQIVAEPMSRAQVAQTIRDHGYFELADLARQQDGSWTCTALAGPGQRVAVTMDKSGRITQTDLPRGVAR